MPDMRAMFVREVTALKDHLEKNSRGVVHHISATSVPEYWSVDVKDSLLGAARGLRIDLEPDMILSHEETARLAYNLGEAEDGTTFLLIMVNYNPTELYLSFAEFSDHEDPDEHPRYPVDGQYTLKGLGENSTSKVGGGVHYAKHLRRAIDILVYKHTVEDPENINDPTREHLYEFPYADIKAVILTGDASTEAMDHMRHILRSKFKYLTIANGMSVVFDQMDPSCVGALGAARAVRAMVDNMNVVHDVIDSTPL